MTKNKKTLQIETKNLEVLLCAKVDGSEKAPFGLRLVETRSNRGEYVKFGEPSIYTLRDSRFSFSENIDEALSQAETLVFLLKEAKKLK